MSSLPPRARLSRCRPVIRLVQWVALVVLFVTARAASGQIPEPPVVLTSARQIADLGPIVPPDRYQASFEAVVTLASTAARRLYVQQGDLGVQLSFARSMPSFRAGQRVAIRGTVLGVDPALRVGSPDVVVLGDGSLPEPKPVSVHRLVAGQECFRYVKVRGMVRDMYSNPSGLTLQLTEDAYPFEVVLASANASLPRDWVDAEVEVTGICYTIYNTGAVRPSGVRLLGGSTNDVRVLTPGVADRFGGRPLLTIAEAARLTNDLKLRYRVAGTVIAHRPGIAYFIDDGTGVMHVDNTYRPLNALSDALRLERDPQTTLRPGERVEVIGARHNWFSLAPSMMTTEFRRVGRAEPVRPIPVTLPELLDGKYPGRLVTLTARLIDVRQWGSTDLQQHLELVLRKDNDVFQATCETEKPARWDLPEDGYVRITGVNDAEGSPSRKRCTLKLRLRDPEDVIPVPAPPIWTRKEFQRIAAATGGVALLAGAWILMQRWQLRRLERRVDERTCDLQASEARKAAVLETALDSIITIDREGRILDFNPAAEKTFGYPRKEVLGREMAEIIIPPALRERHREGLRRAVETGNDSMLGRRIELAALRRDGEEFAVELALARIQAADGPLFTAHIQDISERKRVEAERERALAQEKELSELKSRFVAMVSHEFRTPLGIITSSAEILDAYLDRLTIEDRRANLRDITDATRHMSRMMEEVLLLGRVEAGKMTCRPAPLDLTVFGQRLVDEVGSATNGRCPIHFTAAPGLPEVRADEGLLRHIFTNLLNNAAKYSPPGTPVGFHLEARGPFALFTVRDTGMGIPESDVRLIFQAFHRGSNVGKTPGTGLGMTIVKRCVELHGGRIAFESREGQGTTFVVGFPLFGPAPGGNGEGTTQFFKAAIHGNPLNVVP